MAGFCHGRLILNKKCHVEQDDVPIPDDAHEYHIRKAKNDAAYRGLDYVAYDPNMPISKTGCPTDEVSWIWVSVVHTNHTDV
eukprot:scaffold91404_cov36-Prasinocladus_malaysianus.AAC.1